MQWLAGVLMLHHLGLPMVRYRASGTDVPGFLWCGCNPMHSDGLQAHCRAIDFLFTVFAILVVLFWVLPDLPIPLSVRKGLPWVSLSVSLNIIVTSMICFRLLRMRALVRQVHGPETSCRIYTNLAAMLVESAAPFSILGIGLLVTLAQDGPLLFVFEYVWDVFCVC
jgi:hypothetical protein